MHEDLRPFFAPRGIAIVGASSSPEKLGHAVARNLIASGYSGAIHLVGRAGVGFLGHPMYASLTEVPDPVDLAVLVTPADLVPAAIQDCGARRIRAAMILAAGFREVGPAGVALEQQCLRAASAGGVRLLGPNCIGISDTHLPMDTSFLKPPLPASGGIGLISQSGAFCAAIIDWSRTEDIGFSRIVSLGNKADIRESEILPAMASDENTRAIALYLEGIDDGAAFVRAAATTTRAKPIVALKVGRSEAGRSAASSHTAALAGTDSAYDAAFRRCGILRASSVEEMFDWVRALDRTPLPRGNRIAVLTDAGGPGVIAVDSLDANGMSLAPLGSSTKSALKAILPAAASVANPVDMLASASPTSYAACLELLLKDPQVDGVLLILLPPPMHSGEAVAEKLIPVLKASLKPVLIALLGSALTRAAAERFAESDIPTFPFPERAASTLRALSRREAYLRRPSAPSDRPFAPTSPVNRTAAEWMTAYGIATPQTRFAGSAAEAARLATEIGFPVVLKIASLQISHKSDVGGVLLDVKDAASVLTGYAQVLEAALRHYPGAHVDGVNVQASVSSGQEVILGAVHDPQFGPLVMFGAGGVEAEAMRDVAFALAPLDAADADDLMLRTWAGRRLDGYRNIAAVDRAAARDALIRFSWLVHDHPELGPIEINPLRVLPHGALALDIRAEDSTDPPQPDDSRML